MTEWAPSPLRRVIGAPFTRRAWSELGHTLVSFPVAAAAVIFIVPMLHDGFLWAISATPVRRFGAAARFLARALLGEDIPAPPPIRPALLVKVATADAASAVRLFEVSIAAGGKARVWETKPGVTLKRLPQARVAELAAEAGIAITELQPQSKRAEWWNARVLEPVAWRTRAYFALKLPLAAVGLAVIAAGWLGGVFCLTFPAWWALALRSAFGDLSLAGSFALPTARRRPAARGPVGNARPYRNRPLADAQPAAGFARRADSRARTEPGARRATTPPPGSAASSGTCTTAPRRSSWPWP